MCEKTKLEKYLFEPKNSHAKESLINNKLIFDLKLAAAQDEYFLNVYTPEVDKDGFDIIFDDQDSLTKVQLKTVMAKTSTNSWSIHKTLLRPDLYICEQLGFESSPSGTGYQGGVILIEIEETEESGFQVKYYYTDIIIICGLRDKIIRVVDGPSVKALETFIKSINEGMSNEKITIYKNMFLEAKCPSSLLALMGMHNRVNTGVFRFHLQKLVEPCNEEELASPRDKLIDFVNKELKSVSSSIIP
ncbi:hypothetical protein L9W80_15460 [Vibrio aestuarianus]|uniref:hypothetical protein n=1 Tax=Vibrio aestuarianus TaxID=28171 RepID=UPI00237C694C|nr:hypothetical protein [Vibrio aestuarianus]MDE1351543.1 hypothetical protein [Vibrio aestuarianus]